MHTRRNVIVKIITRQRNVIFQHCGVKKTHFPIHAEKLEHFGLAFFFTKVVCYKYIADAGDTYYVD